MGQTTKNPTKSPAASRGDGGASGAPKSAGKPAATGADGSYLTGKLLIAMPQMPDQRFARTVIYMCAHSAEGAMGLVLNKLVPSLTFPELLQQLSIESKSPTEQIRVHFGGPVETGRGFVLHSADYLRDGSLSVADGIALTATIDILRSIASGQGPRRSLLALGYAGWGPGQLDSEITQNGWLHAPADEALLFDRDLDRKWERAIAKLGFAPEMLSSEVGHA
ncbi:MAG: YqgE/AlgH family protein [Alphaproteobacteria bacterium]|nr:YqgE/AlgH family protein [Alphaproteobacteria bacterium]